MAKQAIKLLIERYGVQKQENYSNKIERDAYTKKHTYRKMSMNYNDTQGVVRSGVKTPLNQLIKWC